MKQSCSRTSMTRTEVPVLRTTCLVKDVVLKQGVKAEIPYFRPTRLRTTSTSSHICVSWTIRKGMHTSRLPKTCIGSGILRRTPTGSLCDSLYQDMVNVFRCTCLPSTSEASIWEASVSTSVPCMSLTPRAISNLSSTGFHTVLALCRTLRVEFVYPPSARPYQTVITTCNLSSIHSEANVL